MNFNDLKHSYQSHKQSKDSIDDERINLGIREINTLKLLANEVGYDLSGSKSVLDLGCADRYLEVACINQNWCYSGLDYEEVNFENSRFPIQENSVDIAISLAVIEHILNPDLFLNEIFRCLKPGGIVYFSTPNFQLDWKNFYNDPTHVRPYTPASLEILLKLKGFQNIHIFPALRCKSIQWYRGKNRFLKAYYLLPFRNDTTLPVPNFLRGHSRSIFGIGMKII